MGIDGSGLLSILRCSYAAADLLRIPGTGVNRLQRLHWQILSK